jgi:solute carrier family 25 citrate transporter 1
MRFFCYGKIKASICSSFGYNEMDAPAWVSFLAGGTGGAVSVCVNNPIDVAKSKIQAGRSPSIIHAIRETVAERGIVGLGSGLTARVPRLFLSQAIQFSLVDQFKSMLQSY